MQAQYAQIVNNESISRITSDNTTEKNAITKLVEDEDEPYEDDSSEEEENENEDEYDDEDDDDEYDEEPEDDEQVMTQCPDYCKCAGEYAAASTATYAYNII